jgi:hypothetical protein
MQRLTRSPGVVELKPFRNRMAHASTYVKWRISRTTFSRQKEVRSRQIDSRIRFRVHVITRTHLGATRTRREAPAEKGKRRDGRIPLRSTGQENTVRAGAGQPPVAVGETRSNVSCVWVVRPVQTRTVRSTCQRACFSFLFRGYLRWPWPCVRGGRGCSWRLILIRESLSPSRAGGTEIGTPTEEIGATRVHTRPTGHRRITGEIANMHARFRKLNVWQPRLITSPTSLLCRQFYINLV